MIIKKNTKIHSRSRARKLLEEKRKGRHSGLGKRSGTKTARMPEKVLWIRRQRVLRRLIKKYRASKKIDKHLYKKLYLGAKGNQFKNKKALIEFIFKTKQENERINLDAQAEAKRRAKK